MSVCLGAGVPSHTHIHSHTHGKKKQFKISPLCFLPYLSFPLNSINLLFNITFSIYSLGLLYMCTMRFEHVHPPFSSSNSL